MDRDVGVGLVSLIGVEPSHRFGASFFELASFRECLALSQLSVSQVASSEKGHPIRSLAVPCFQQKQHHKTQQSIAGLALTITHAFTPSNK